MRSIKLVVQEDITGCGIASVAALAGVSYFRARFMAAKLGIAPQDPELWSDTWAVRTLLKTFGVLVDEKPRRFLSWQKLPHRALLAVKWHRKNGKSFWHWVVFVREKNLSCVLDSKKTLKKNRRTDFGRMKPKWFMEVLPK